MQAQLKSKLYAACQLLCTSIHRHLLEQSACFTARAPLCHQGLQHAKCTVSDTAVIIESAVLKQVCYSTCLQFSQHFTPL